MILWVRGEDWSDGRWSLEGRRVSAWVGNDSRVMGEKERNTCPRVSQYHQAEVVRGTGLRRVARRGTTSWWNSTWLFKCRTSKGIRGAAVVLMFSSTEALDS